MTAVLPTQDDLAAGRELDAEVVVKVMGWQRLPNSIAAWKPPGDNRIWLDVNLPAYSTDISAAWQVLQGWSMTLAHAEGLSWHCHLMRCTREGEWQSGEGHANTAPLAICRAALKAVSG